MPTRSAARNTMSLMTLGQASASTQRRMAVSLSHVETSPKREAGRAPALARNGASTLGLGQLEPGVDDGVRIQRHRFDALFHEPLGEVRVIRRALAADA